MARLPNGLRKARGDWQHPLYGARRAKPANPPAKTPEQIAAAEKVYQDFIESRGWNKPATAPHEKIADREARVAVEGDTDLNHDNVEPAE